jgi:hypothetical protein
MPVRMCDVDPGEGRPLTARLPLVAGWHGVHNFHPGRRPLPLKNLASDDHIPYEDLDPPVVELVRSLNRLPGIEPITACGGHSEPVSEGSLPADRWMVGFHLEAWDPGALVAVPTREGWVSLEWLAWLINDETDYPALGMEVPINRPYRPGVTLRPWSRPPYLYYPGRGLHFVMTAGAAPAAWNPTNSRH